MKKLNLNEKGFTLIELLAVIVILAIVMVLASQSVLPFMRNASKDSFAIEANGAIDAASNAISLHNVGQLDLSATKSSEGFTRYDTGFYCFTLKFLVDQGLFSLREDKVNGSTPEYAGFVIAKKGDSSFKYALVFRNKKFIYNSKKANGYEEAGSIDKDSTLIKEYTSGDSTSYACPSTKEAANIVAKS